MTGTNNLPFLLMIHLTFSWNRNTNQILVCLQEGDIKRTRVQKRLGSEKRRFRGRFLKFGRIPHNIVVFIVVFGTFWKINYFVDWTNQWKWGKHLIFKEICLPKWHKLRKKVGKFVMSENLIQGWSDRFSDSAPN